jgi:hypothetical protein
MLRPLDNPKCIAHASAGMACGQAGAGGGGSRSGGGGKSVELRSGTQLVLSLLLSLLVLLVPKYEY